jgi:hypothetical protein
VTEDEGSDGSSLGRRGFEIFRANRVRRLGPTVFLVNTESGVGSFIVELQDGNWVCDCDGQLNECEHRYAARLCAATSRTLAMEEDEPQLRCRYCGSLDVSSCGYRYNAYGIRKRYQCNECLRKFSVRYVERKDQGGPPSEIVWVLSEVGMILNKLEALLEKLSSLTLTVNVLGEAPPLHAQGSSEGTNCDGLHNMESRNQQNPRSEGRS